MSETAKQPVNLMRDKLEPLIASINAKHEPNAGLLLAKGLRCFEVGAKEAKTMLIDRFCQVKPSELYAQALERFRVAASSDQHVIFEATTQHRLMMGLSTGGGLETGVTLNHSYGMPMLPGSSLKGIARAHAERIELKSEILAVLFGDSRDCEETGFAAGSGCLVWHDAWFVPSSNSNSFVPEVVTVHHPDYYAGAAEAGDLSISEKSETGSAKKIVQATDFDSPVPNQQLAVQGKFLFVVEGETQWAEFGSELLAAALRQQGVGAKTASGYGYFTQPSKAKKPEPTGPMHQDPNIDLLWRFEREVTKESNKVSWVNQGPGGDKPKAQIDELELDLDSLYRQALGWKGDARSEALRVITDLVSMFIGKPAKSNSKWKGKLKQLAGS